MEGYLSNLVYVCVCLLLGEKKTVVTYVKTAKKKPPKKKCYKTIIYT